VISRRLRGDTTQPPSSETTASAEVLTGGAAPAPVESAGSGVDSAGESEPVVRSGADDARKTERAEGLGDDDAGEETGERAALGSAEGLVIQEMVPAETFEELPVATASSEVLSPDELVSQLAAAADSDDVATDGDRPEPAAVDAPPSDVARASVVELADEKVAAERHADDADDAITEEDALDSRSALDADDAAGDEADTALVSVESMIVGVRQLGASPPHATLGASQPDPDPAAQPEADTPAYVATRPAKVLFARGSSYLLTQVEVARGIDIEFALPVDVEEHAFDVEMRIQELGSDRELRGSFAAAEEPTTQIAPLRSLQVPAGWLQPGRYAIELSAPTAEGFEPEAAHLRILDGD